MISEGPVQAWNGLLEELVIFNNLFPFVMVLNTFLNFHDKHIVQVKKTSSFLHSTLVFLIHVQTVYCKHCSLVGTEKGKNKMKSPYLHH